MKLHESINTLRTFAEYVSTLEWHGVPGRSLDRIDPAGDYAPGNLRWATAKQQANNKRINKILQPGYSTFGFTITSLPTKSFRDSYKLACLCNACGSIVYQLPQRLLSGRVTTCLTCFNNAQISKSLGVEETSYAGLLGKHSSNFNINDIVPGAELHGFRVLNGAMVPTRDGLKVICECLVCRSLVKQRRGRLSAGRPVKCLTCLNQAQKKAALLRKEAKAATVQP